MHHELKTIDRQIATVSRECGIRLDLHGLEHESYRRKRAELARLKQDRQALKWEIAAASGQAVLA